MSKRITIASNPFDKHRSAAEAVMYGEVKPAERTEETKEVDPVDDVDTNGQVEQQEQHIQQIQQDKEGPKKHTTRQFPGKQHLHLILPDEQASMVKALAKFNGISVNKFMSQAIQTMYETQWKDVYDIMQKMQHKMGLDKKSSKELFS